VIPRLSFPARAASGRIQSISPAHTDAAGSSDTTPLLAEPSSRERTHRRRQAVLLLQGVWPWRLQLGWLEAFARFGGSFFHYERWPMRAWQTALMVALIDDMVRYADYPQARFGNTHTNVLFGFAPNPETVSRHWGSDRPPEALFWLAPGVLVSLLLLNVLRAACYHLSSGAGFSDEDALSLIHNLGQTSLASRFPLNYRAIAILASFAGRERDGAQENRAQATEQAMTHLTFHLDARRPWLRRVYTRYHLWRQGLEPNGSVDGVWPYAFGLWVLCQFAVGLFSRYHYGRLLGDKLTHVLDYVNRQAACEALDKQFFYAAWPDQEVCALCPDWDFVRLADSDGLQACVEGLLQQPLPPEDLARRLTRLQGHAGLMRVDLSGYGWAYAWSPGEFAQVLEALQALLNASPDGLQRLDVSNRLRHQGLVAPAKLQALAVFIEQAKPREMGMRYYRLGQEGWANLIPAFVNNDTTYLDVSFTDFGDAGVLNMTTVLPGSALMQFTARDSRLSDGSARVLHRVWADSALASLDLAGNAFTSSGLAAFAAMFSQRPGTLLDVSGTRLSAQGARHFWPIVRHVEQLVVQDCGLSEAAVASLGPWLANSTLQALDMTHNPLRDAAVLDLTPHVMASMVRDWRLAYTLLSPLGFGELGAQLPLAVHLQALDVSGCAVDDDLATFFAGVVQSGLHTLSLDNVGLTNRGLAHFTEALRRYRHTTLRALTLNDNAVSSDATAVFIEAIGGSNCCHRLSLAGNGLNDTVLTAVGRLLAKERLQLLQMRENRLTDLAALVPHGRSLQVLDVADNDLTSVGVMAWVQASIEPMSYFARLGGDTLTRAQRRDFSQLEATGKLRFWDVSGNWLTDDEGIHGLCRVAEQANYAVNVSGNPSEVVPRACQRPSATRALPLGGVLGPGLLHLPWALASALRVLPQAPSPRLFQAAPQRESLTGMSVYAGLVLVLSVLWVLRFCRLSRVRQASSPTPEVPRSAGC
jgi:Leucine Rich repeat